MNKGGDNDITTLEKILTT